MSWILQTGLSTIKFENGVVFRNYIHASNQVGYFGFENLPDSDGKQVLRQPVIYILN